MICDTTTSSETWSFENGLQSEIGDTLYPTSLVEYMCMVVESGIFKEGERVDALRVLNWVIILVKNITTHTLFQAGHFMSYNKFEHINKKKK